MAVVPAGGGGGGRIVVLIRMLVGVGAEVGGRKIEDAILVEVAHHDAARRDPDREG